MKRVVYNSPVILNFTLLSLAVLALNVVTSGLTNQLFFSVYRGSLTDPLFYFRLVGHVLGHQSFEHFAGNFMYILLVGPMVEERYGSRQLVKMILLTAFLTGLLQVIFFPRYALLGASGIVFMLMLLSSATNFKRGELPLTLIIVAVLYIGQEFWAGLYAADNVSHFAHIIGGVCGGIFGLNQPARR